MDLTAPCIQWDDCAIFISMPMGSLCIHNDSLSYLSYLTITTMIYDVAYCTHIRIIMGLLHIEWHGEEAIGGCEMGMGFGDDDCKLWCIYLPFADGLDHPFIVILGMI